MPSRLRVVSNWESLRLHETMSGPKYERAHWILEVDPHRLWAGQSVKSWVGSCGDTYWKKGKGRKLCLLGHNCDAFSPVRQTSLA